MPLSYPPYIEPARPKSKLLIITLIVIGVIIIVAGVYAYINIFLAHSEPINWGDNNTPVSSGPLNNTWNCTADIYNCANFTSMAEAQVAFDYCIGQGKGDVWNLDRDGNGKVCTSYNYPPLPGL